MRRRRTLIVLLLALVSGTLAGYSALQFMRERPAAAVASNNDAVAPVVVALRELPLGAIVRENDVQVVDWPANRLPFGAIGSTAQVVGRGLIVPINANEPFLETKLAGIGEGGGLPVIIPQGQRALSMRVDDVMAVAGFVIPGTRVDVLLTLTPQGASEPMTQAVMQNITALASGQDIQHDAEGKPVVTSVITFLVTPEQAEQLTLASTQGRIQLALRNMSDMEEFETDGARMSELLTGRRAPRPRARTTVATGRSSDGIIEFYRAGVRTLISY